MNSQPLLVNSEDINLGSDELGLGPGTATLVVVMPTLWMSFSAKADLRRAVTASYGQASSCTIYPHLRDLNSATEWAHIL